jgi:hypothetical protein
VRRGRIASHLPEDDGEPQRHQQRNIDLGSLVQADAASGTMLFALMNSDMVRIQLYVPKDDAFGVTPEPRPWCVPEMPGREFSGTVARIADALQPGSRTLLTEIDVPNRDDACRRASIAASSSGSRARRRR